MVNSRRGRSVRLGRAMTPFVFIAVSLLANAPPHAKLSYRPGPGAIACQQQQLEDAVATRLGYNPFIPDAPLQVVVEISGQTKLQARVRISQPNRKPTETALNGPSDCLALTDALALALAVAIDPLMLTRPAPTKVAEVAEPSPEPVVPERKVVEHVAPPAPEIERGPTVRFSLHGMGGLEVGTIPNGWASASIGSRLTRGALGLEVDALVVIPGTTTFQPMGQATSWAIGGTAAGCWLWHGLGVCGALRGSGLRFQALDLPEQKAGWVGFVAAGPRVSVLLPWVPKTFALRLQGELLVPFVRAAMQISQDTVWRQSVIGLLQLGGELYIL